MNKILAILSIMALSIFILSGCIGESVELTKDNAQKVAEYTSSLIARYDKNGKSRLMSDSDLVAQEAVEIDKLTKEVELRAKIASVSDDDAKSSNRQGVGDSNSDILGSANDTSMQLIEDIAQFFDVGEFAIEYVGYDIKSSYPDDIANDVIFTIDASEGCSLVIVNLSVKSIDGTDKRFNMLNKQEQFAISINGGTNVNRLSTLLLDDFAMYDADIGAEPKKLVLLYEIRSDKLDSIEDIKLYASDGVKKGYIELN